MTMLEHPPWDVDRELEAFDELEPLDELELDTPGLTPSWLRPAGPASPARSLSTALARPVPLAVPAAPRPLRRAGALVVALALVAGGLAGGVVARMTERPDAASTVPVAGAPASSVPSTVGTGTGAVATFDVPGVIEQVGRSVVSIDVTATATAPWGRTYQEEGAGTGFVLSADGLIATNEHVIDGADTISVTLPDGTQVPATVVGSSESEDLAVLSVDRTGLVPLTFGSSSSLRVGTAVVAVGNALALEGGLTASLGIISAKGRSITTTSGATYENLLQTDAAINAGDSGGPLVDRAGQVVGINTAGTTQAENIGFAIPIDDAGPVLARLAGGTTAA